MRPTCQCRWPINPRTERAPSFAQVHNLAAAASHATSPAMGKSSSAAAAAVVSTKRKSRSGALSLEEVKSLGSELLSSRAHLNHAPVLLALLSPTARLDLALEALISLQSFFVPLIPSIPSAAAAAAGDGCGDPERVFGSWLRQRFDELVASLVELSVSPQSDDAIRVGFELVLLSCHLTWLVMLAFFLSGPGCSTGCSYGFREAGKGWQLSVSNLSQVYLCCREYSLSRLITSMRFYILALLSMSGKCPLSRN